MQYTGGIITKGDAINTSERYLEDNGGCSMRPWCVMRISGDIISARKDVEYITSTPLGHHNYDKEVLSTLERSHGEYWGDP